MPIIWPTDKRQLFERGLIRITKFCETNNLPTPSVQVIKSENWYFDACAYYRPDIPSERDFLERNNSKGNGLKSKGYGVGINICLEKCAGCAEQNGNERNWNWPCSTTDREPMGVLCHELGHHVDWLVGEKKERYSSDYSGKVRIAAGEAQISGYCPDDSEWFAEMFRVFVLNPNLLEQLRPDTFDILSRVWKPVDCLGWNERVGVNCPKRVFNSLLNKGAWL